MQWLFLLRAKRIEDSTTYEHLGFCGECSAEIELSWNARTDTRNERVCCSIFPRFLGRFWGDARSRNLSERLLRLPEAHMTISQYLYCCSDTNNRATVFSEHLSLHTVLQAALALRAVFSMPANLYFVSS